MVAGIIAFLQALPAILNLIGRLGNWMTEHSINDWINDLEKSIDLLEKAESSQEKLDAAQRLVSAIRNLK